MKTLIGVKKSSAVLNVCGLAMLAVLSVATAKTALAGPSPVDTFDTQANCDTRYWNPGVHAGIAYGTGHYSRLACNEPVPCVKCCCCYKHYYKHHKHFKHRHHAKTCAR